MYFTKRKIRKSSLFRQCGIGASDIFIALVVLGILGVLFYNIYAKYQSKKNMQASSVYMKTDASKVLESISNDFLYATVYAAGCKNAGILKPKYGGISDPDEISMLYAPPFSTKPLVKDMVNANSTLTVEIGSPFRIGQRVAVCSDSGIEWFNISNIGHNEELGVSEIVADLVDGNAPFEQPCESGSMLGPFTWVRYHIVAEEGKPSILMRSVEGEDPKPVAENIENLKIEYLIEGSDIPLVEPFNMSSVVAINVKVTARSSKEDLLTMDGVNSLTGALDGFKRITLPAIMPFAPLDTKNIKDLVFRIAKDKSTGMDIPLLVSGKEDKKDNK